MNTQSTQNGPHTYDGARDGWQHGKVYPLEAGRARPNWLRVIALAAAFVALVVWKVAL